MGDAGMKVPRPVRTSGRGAGSANPTPRSSALVPEGFTPSAELLRQAGDLYRSLTGDGAGAGLEAQTPVGNISLDDMLAMIDFTTGTPRAGTVLATAVAQTGTDLLSSLPALKTGLTPKGPLGTTTMELWDKFMPQEQGELPGEPSTSRQTLADLATATPTTAEAVAAAATAAAAAANAALEDMPGSPAGKKPAQQESRGAARRSAPKRKHADGEEDFDGEEAGGEAKKARGGADPSQRVMNNRASARRSRERKMQHTVDLEKKVELLEAENAKLKAENAKLKGK